MTIIVFDARGSARLDFVTPASKDLLRCVLAIPYIRMIRGQQKVIKSTIKNKSVIIKDNDTGNK